MQSNPPPDEVTRLLRLIGRRVRVHREALGFSQDELGERAGLGGGRIE
ncbi:hypothetical protein [Streptomyces sp. BK79]